MTNKKSPSREADYPDSVRSVCERDGMTCFLCGHKHATVHTMQLDLINPTLGYNQRNLVAACKPCAKRRNGKALSAYWTERVSAVATERAHIEAMSMSKATIRRVKELTMYSKWPMTKDDSEVPIAMGFKGPFDDGDVLDRNVHGTVYSFVYDEDLDTLVFRGTYPAKQ